MAHTTKQLRQEQDQAQPDGRRAGRSTGSTRMAAADQRGERGTHEGVGAPTRGGRGRLSGRISGTLSGRDDALLRAVDTYTYLTAEQVCRLYYSPGSLEYVRRQLKRLAEDDYLQRLRLPATGPGNQPFVYRLARHGFAYLAAAGVAIPSRFRPAEHWEHSALFLRHTLAVNEVLIAGVRLEEEVADVRLLEMRHEHALKRAPMRVTLADGAGMSTAALTGATLAPDGWLDYALPRGRMSVLLELDRGTEGREALQRKLRALLACARGPYKAYFGSGSLNVALATTSGERRAQALLDWCEHVLRASGSQDLAAVFLVTALRSGPLDARQTFLAPIWRQPFGRQLVSLLRL